MTTRTLFFVGVLSVLLAACSSTGKRNITFSFADSNADGKLSKQEFSTVTSNSTLKFVDTNRDGFVSATEWEAAGLRHNSKSHDFNHIDDDGDGKVTSKELLGYITDHVGYGKLVSELDKDGDDLIHEDEYREAEKSYLQLHLLEIDLP